MKTLRWADLSAEEQAELQQLIRSPAAGAAWAPSNDWIGFVLLALPAAVAGTVALGMSFGFGSSIGTFQFEWREIGLETALTMALRRHLFLLPLGFALWLALFLVRNRKRRGYAVTSFATIRVAGHRLRLIRHGDVARVTRHIIRSRRSSFTVFELYDREGEKLTCLTHGTFADAAIAAIQRGRAEPLPVTIEPATDRL
ncbi:MAG: hypothetical protein JNJ88_02470 [Planctomycetes bacterium]|nr:hypothetical protein [Planctomycetota bacterium]